VSAAKSAHLSVPSINPHHSSRLGFSTTSRKHPPFCSTAWGSLCHRVTGSSRLPRPAAHFSLTSITPRGGVRMWLKHYWSLLPHTCPSLCAFHTLVPPLPSGLPDTPHPPEVLRVPSYRQLPSFRNPEHPVFFKHNYVDTTIRLIYLPLSLTTHRCYNIPNTLQDTVCDTRNIRNCGPCSGESINHKHLSDSH